jgi:polysaccharide export outer membrane protein
LADNENFETIDIDLLLRGQVELNRNINNGDVVFVPEADLVFFTGNVNKPGTLVMRVPVPLSQALAMAGGLSNGAAKDRIRIFRTQAGSTKRREISANLDAIMKSSAEDPLLQANDLIFVPDATGRNAGITVLKTFTGALSLSLGAAILR